MNYSETKLPIRDVLLELKDFPHGFGGSGIEVAERLSDSLHHPR